MSTRMRIAKMDREELLRRCKEGSIYADFVTIGKWVKGHYDYLCGECGKSSTYFIEGYFDYIAENPNFCPFCGADMREGDVE